MTSSKTQHALQWLAVLPAAICALAVMRILWRWSARYAGVDFGDVGVLTSIFSLSSDLLSSVAFVVGGALTAPMRRTVVAVVLGTAHATFWGTLMFFEIAADRVIGFSNRPGLIWVIVGAVLGVAYIREEERKL